MAKTKFSIPESSFDFLSKLKKHNDREWFNAHKERFLKEQAYIERFAGQLLLELNAHDVIETPDGKKSLHRIYRDIRFSKEKIPYKTYWSGNFKRASKYRRGGYYFHLEPGNSFLAGGFWGPNSEDMKRIRDEFSFDATPFRNILKNKKFVSTFQSLEGEKIKTTPKGYDPNDPAIDLLRYKQFIVIKKFSDNEVLSDTFLKKANEVFKNMRPFFDYMSEILTTDTNGLEK